MSVILAGSCCWPSAAANRRCAMDCSAKFDLVANCATSMIPRNAASIHRTLSA